MATLTLDLNLFGKCYLFFAALQDAARKFAISPARDAVQTTVHPWKVMLADDDEDDRFLFRQAVKELSPSIQLATYGDGVELLTFLRNATDNLPDLIFLDLNMPGKNGIDCLEALKDTEHLKHIPVIIYSTSANINQVDETFSKGAQHYIQKPDSFSQIKQVLQKVFDLPPADAWKQVERKFFQLS